MEPTGVDWRQGEDVFNRAITESCNRLGKADSLPVEQHGRPLTRMTLITSFGWHLNTVTASRTFRPPTS